jgi:hypothetical protein
MARIRTIKPEFPQSESIGRVGRDARLLFIQLWTLCDDHGKTRAASRMLASLLYPYDDDAPHLIEGWLGELERERCIERYCVDGHDYLRIVNWQAHQRIDRPSASRFPDPREPSRASDAGSRIEEGTRESDSDAEASAADAARQVGDLKMATFDAGVKILVDAGKRESAARAMIGKWRKEHSDEAVLAAIRQAERHTVSEPVSFIAACLKVDHPSDGPPRPADQVVAEFEAKGAWDGVH